MVGIYIKWLFARIEIKSAFYQMLHQLKTGWKYIMSKDILYPLRRLHSRIYEFRTIALPIILQRLRKPKAIFLVLTPEHGNLGDHAIAKAEIRILRNINVDYIELSGKVLSTLLYSNLMCLLNGRTILINGGGNLGTLWIGVEYLIRKIIEKNPRSSIVILPSSLYYEDSIWGNQEKEESVKVYGKHSNLYLYARETASFSSMSKIYPNVKLIPDIVLSLNECNNQQVRHGCLLCLRKDHEKTLTINDEKLIIQQAKIFFKNDVNYTDMCVNYAVNSQEREKELTKKFNEFKSASLVITDRLHGMIFCAITGTPCIVVNSKSPKVFGCYKWIKELEYIKFACDVTEIETLYREIPQKEFIYDNSKLLHYYDELATDILKIIRKK